MTITSVAATVDATGIHAPALADILTYLQDTYRTIYGADVYLGNDSQDGQFIAALASAINDCNAASVAVYNSFSPSTAQGNGLSSRVKMNGIYRKVPTNSTVDLTIVGVANTVISNGVVSDSNGYKWDLPSTVTIDSTGSVLVTATCETQGAIAAAIGTVTKIETPTFGWQTASNPSIAILGQPVETDSELRIRQSISMAAPSQTVFEGIIGSVANIAGVTRLKGYENSTDTTDANGIPSHSIAVVVEGGDATTIAQTIAFKITPGTGTFGNITTTVIDAANSTHLISFKRPVEALITVNLTIHALTGYSSQVLPMIQQLVANFINALQIGSNVVYSKLFVPANLDNNQFGSTYSITSMTINKNSGTNVSTDIAIAFDEVAYCAPANVIITVV